MGTPNADRIRELAGRVAATNPWLATELNFVAIDVAMLEGRSHQTALAEAERTVIPFMQRARPGIRRSDPDRTPPAAA